MRARYCAFVRGETAFLIRTAHPLERARVDMRGLRASCALDWLGLEIISHQRGGTDDRDGLVHFRARFRGPDGAERVHDERSRFIRIGGSWVYRDAKG
jgi:SEC-C motif-containing protein